MGPGQYLRTTYQQPFLRFNQGIGHRASSVRIDKITRLQKRKRLEESARHGSRWPWKFKCINLLWIKVQLVEQKVQKPKTFGEGQITLTRKTFLVHSAIRLRPSCNSPPRAFYDTTLYVYECEHFKYSQI